MEFRGVLHGAWQHRVLGVIMGFGVVSGDLGPQQGFAK